MRFPRSSGCLAAALLACCALTSALATPPAPTSPTPASRPAAAAPVSASNPSAPAAPAPAASTDPMARRVAACIACHGRQGVAANAGYLPRIAGKPSAYLYHQLSAFRDGRRSHPAMNRMVELLSDDYLREIAAWFSALDYPYPPPEPADARAAQLERGRQLALQGDATRKLPACVQCHGERLTGLLPASPSLLGLPRQYLAAQLGAMQTGQRHALAPDCMTQVARALEPDDLNAVINWLAAQPVPAHGKPQAPVRELPLRCGGMQP